MRNVKIKFRDGYNKLVGKQPLIVEYNKIKEAICTHTDRMPSGDKKDKILAAFDAMDETTVTPASNGVALSIGSGFDEYYTSNAKLRKKIAEGKAIMAKYDIKMRSESR